MAKVLIMTVNEATYTEEALTFLAGEDMAREILAEGYRRVLSTNEGARSSLFYPADKILNVMVVE